MSFFFPEPRRAAVPKPGQRLLAIAALCFAGACHAQSASSGAFSDPASSAPDVRIYGILDAGIRHVDQSSAAGALTQFSSGLNTSRVGIRGNETIDPELRAILRLESGFSPATGVQSNTALFDRSAYAGLGGTAWEFRAGRQEGFGYEQAATGVTDPLYMALNLPDYSSPAAAGSKAPVLGANPLQAVYSYTYGQLRYNNAIKVTGNVGSFSGGLLYSLGGVSGAFSSGSARAAHVGWAGGPAQLDAILQQSEDLHGNLSTLDVLAGSWTWDAWKFQAAVHDLHIDPAFDSTNLGNGASSTGILGTSTTVSTTLSGAKQEFHFDVTDFGATWKVLPNVPVSLVAYRTRSDGAGEGHSTALVALGKYYLGPRTALYLEADHDNESGRLATKPVSTVTIATAFTAGINLRF